MALARTPTVEVAHAAVCGLLPWLAMTDDRWIPAAAVLLISVHSYAVRSSWGEPVRSLAIVGLALAAIGGSTGWLAVCGWLVGVAAVGGAVLALPGLHRGRRPDGLDLAITVAWAATLFLGAGATGDLRWGWVAPLLVLLATRRSFFFWSNPKPLATGRLGPPGRKVRGTLSINGVIPGADGLPRTGPLELEVLAGTTLAVLCDDEVVSDLAEVVAGRRVPLNGQVCVDGVPHEPDQSPIAVVAVGEPFTVGNLEDNLSVLRGEALDDGIRAAAREACSLDAVEKALGTAMLAADGSPLDQLQRLLIQAGRVLASHYRVVVVVDPMPWVNPVRAEIWRQAVVRASVGRTALWVTGDRLLAGSADHAVELRYGTLRQFERDGR